MVNWLITVVNCTLVNCTLVNIYILLCDKKAIFVVQNTKMCTYFASDAFFNTHLFFGITKP
jgi:hypothetical protein